MIKMEEILCSIHNYTKFSGRDISLYSLAQAALDCGADVLFTTDRNIYLSGHDQFYYRSGRRLLLICGEELFDPLNRDQQHYLSLGIEKEQFNLNVSNPQSEVRILVDLTFRHNKSVLDVIIHYTVSSRLRLFSLCTDDFFVILYDSFPVVFQYVTCRSVRPCCRLCP